MKAVWRGAVLVGLLISVAACGDPSYVVTDLALERPSWDEVTPTATFGRTSWPGGAEPVTPDSTYAYLYDSNYDTLYAGPPGPIAVPDAQLGDREGLLVEVCGRISGQTICRQRGFAASPKRIEVASEIGYPHQEDTGEARYRLDVAVERQRFGRDDWEPLDAPALDMFTRASVQGSDGGAVEAPVAPGQGTLHLRRAPGYDDFAFALNSALYDDRRAAVSFDLFARLNGGSAERVDGGVLTVEQKEPAERRGDVAELAQLAAGHLVERLAAGRRPRASVYIEDWRHNAITDRYTITLELVWEDRDRFFRTRRRVEGTLVAHASGQDASFELQGGSRGGRERWQERVGDDEMALPRLQRPDVTRREESVGPDGTTGRTGAGVW